jgi:hypothetical protein
VDRAHVRERAGLPERERELRAVAISPESNARSLSEVTVCGTLRLSSLIQVTVVPGAIVITAHKHEVLMCTAPAPTGGATVASGGGKVPSGDTEIVASSCPRM